MKYTARISKPIRGILILFLVAVLLMGFVGCSAYSVRADDNIKEAGIGDNVSAGSDVNSNTESGITVKEILTMHVIDVGQADSILIENGAAAMLIDGGNNEDAETIIKYINNQGISKFDYVIGTHPHEDHIGSLDQVIKSYEVDKIIMPKVQANTKTFEDLLDAIISKGLKVTAPVPGTKYKLGEAEFTILAPNGTGYEDLNNYSVVIKLVHGSNSILLTGDAEDVSEREMLAKKYDLGADILKVAHHASNSSSISEYLRAVKPKVAIISVGKDNPYDLPNEYALKRIADTGAEIIRTDQSGTIVVTSDGTSIKLDKSIQNSLAPALPQVPIIYIGNVNSKKFHSISCRNLPYEKNRIYFESRDTAVKAGYEPCKNCNP